MFCSGSISTLIRFWVLSFWKLSAAFTMISSIAGISKWKKIGVRMYRKFCRVLARRRSTCKEYGRWRSRTPTNTAGKAQYFQHKYLVSIRYVLTKSSSDRSFQCHPLLCLLISFWTYSQIISQAVQIFKNLNFKYHHLYL